ncbi:MAG: pilus assembly protein [Roseburia sp.]
MSLFLHIWNRVINKKKSLPNRNSYQCPSVNMSAAKGTPRFTCKASFTVEAAFVIPLLTCFFALLLFFFHILEIQLQVQTGLDTVGRKLAVYTGVWQGEEGKAEEIVEIATAKLFLQKELSGSAELEEWIEGGITGISLIHSEVSQDELELVATYQVKFPLNLLDSFSVSAVQKTKVRKWTGWNTGEEDETDCWVYITENGSVYHTTKSCSYLDLSIQTVPYSELEYRRSLSGAIYYPCPICAKKGKEMGTVYITDYGNRYHTDLNCSGLKRTIYMVRKSEVGDRRACSKCGKEGGT